MWRMVGSLAMQVWGEVFRFRTRGGDGTGMRLRQLCVHAVHAGLCDLEHREAGGGGDGDRDIGY